MCCPYGHEFHSRLHVHPDARPLAANNEVVHTQCASKKGFCVNTELTVGHVIDRLIDLGLVKISTKMGDQ